MFPVHQNACFVGLYFFGGRNEYPRRLTSTKLPTPSYHFYLPAQYLVQFMTYCFKSWQYWNWKAGKVLRKSKRVAHWRDPANMNLVDVQPYNSSEALYHAVPALLQQHHVVLHELWIRWLWNDEIRTPSKSHYKQWFTKFIFLVHLTSKKPRIQQKPALKNKFSLAILCLNDKFNPRYIRKMIIKREHLLLTEFGLVMNSCFDQ